MKKYNSTSLYVISLIFLILLWYFFALIINNDIIIPLPNNVFKYVLDVLSNRESYSIIGTTLLRTARGFIISLLIALVITALCKIYPILSVVFDPIYAITKSIPNASYIIIALIWLGAEGSVSFITFMILFPIFFNGFTNILNSENNRIYDAETIYQDTVLMRIKKRILPLQLREALHTGKTAASMGFKVGVMAEILGQVKIGIGRKLYYAKLNLDTTGLFAWTLVIIALAIIIDMVFNLLIKLQEAEEQ